MSLLSASYPTIKPSLNLDFARTKTLDPRVTFSRSSTATYFDELGILRTAAAGVARFDHNPTTGESLGLLIEEQRANLLTYSEAFNDGIWNKGTAGSIISNTVVSPNGTLTADEYTWATTTSSYALLSQTVLGNAATTHTYSIWLKRPLGSGSRTVRLVLSDVNLSSDASLNFTVTEQWQRFQYSRSANNTGLIGVGLNPGTSNGIVAGEVLHVWGAQLEAGAFATSYIPTVAASVTRAADSASMTGTNFSSWFNNTSGTFITEFSMYSALGQLRRVWDIENSNVAVYNTFLALNGFSAADTNIYVEAYNNAIAGYTKNLGTFANNTKHKVSFAFALNNYSATKNGETTTTSGTVVPANLNILYLGRHRDGFWFNGHMAKFAYYPISVTNEQLQGLTT